MERFSQYYISLIFKVLINWSHTEGWVGLEGTGALAFRTRVLLKYFQGIMQP